MKICYVVNTTCQDIHADLAYVSTRFVRTVHPAAQIVCVTDSQSNDDMQRQKHPLLAAVDQTLAIDVPVESLQAKNRWLKPRLRELVPGDFLYVDSDTLCIRRIDSLFREINSNSAKPVFDLAIARDVNIRRRDESRRKGDEEFWPSLRELGWRSPDAGYFNAGVILFRDTPAAHALCRRWAELWAISCRTGYIYDQPALNEAIRECAPRLRVLDPCFNAMILAKPRLVFSARIVHLFASVASVLECTPFFRLVRDVRTTGTLQGSAIAAVLADPFSWASHDAFPGQCWRKNPLGAMRLSMERFVRTGDLRIRKAV
jgi:hypothetical protein